MQDAKDRLADDKVMIEKLGGEEAVKKEQEKNEMLARLKFDMVYRRVNEQELASKTDLCQTIVDLLRVQIPGVGAMQMKEKIKNRDVQVYCALKQVSFEILGL